MLLDPGVITAILLTYAPYAGDEEPTAAREERMHTIELSIVRASRKATCTGDFNSDPCIRTWKGRPAEAAAALLTLVRFESSAWLHVHAGHCLPHECDNGKAHSLWQLHESNIVSHDDWVRMHDCTQEATDLAAELALRVLRAARSCGTVEGMFSKYGSGSTCTLSLGEPRARYYQELLRRH